MMSILQLSPAFSKEGQQLSIHTFHIKICMMINILPASTFCTKLTGSYSNDSALNVSINDTGSTDAYYRYTFVNVKDSLHKNKLTSRAFRSWINIFRSHE
jgi:hypothetical protein